MVLQLPDRALMHTCIQTDAHLFIYWSNSSAVVNATAADGGGGGGNGDGVDGSAADVHTDVAN